MSPTGELPYSHCPPMAVAAGNLLLFLFFFFFLPENTLEVEAGVRAGQRAIKGKTNMMEINAIRAGTRLLRAECFMIC